MLYSSTISSSFPLHNLGGAAVTAFAMLCDWLIQPNYTGWLCSLPLIQAVFDPPPCAARLFFLQSVWPWPQSLPLSLLPLDMRVRLAREPGGRGQPNQEMERVSASYVISYPKSARGAFINVKCCSCRELMVLAGSLVNAPQINTVGSANYWATSGKAFLS